MNTSGVWFKAFIDICCTFDLGCQIHKNTSMWQVLFVKLIVHVVSATLSNYQGRKSEITNLIQS